MLALNSDTKVGVVSDGELDGNECAPVVVKAVQVGAERAVSVVVVVSNRRGIYQGPVLDQVLFWSTFSSFFL